MTIQTTTKSTRVTDIRVGDTVRIGGHDLLVMSTMEGYPRDRQLLRFAGDTDSLVFAKDSNIPKVRPLRTFERGDVVMVDGQVSPQIRDDKGGWHFAAFPEGTIESGHTDGELSDKIDNRQATFVFDRSEHRA